MLCRARLFSKIDRMAKFAAILGGIAGTIIAICWGFYRAGDSSAKAEDRLRDYKEAMRLVDRITKPVPSSSDFRNAARLAIKRRMR